MNDRESSSSASIYVNKLAAARRQLCAAIRLFFSEEDELAIHTIASAAYRIIRDLKKQRGLDEANDYYISMILGIVRLHHLGKLTMDDLENEQMQEIVKWIEKLPTSPSNRNHIQTSISKETRNDFYEKVNKSANFLKHADRDSADLLSLDEIDNFFMLMQTYASYLDLDKKNFVEEGYILYIYSCVEAGTVGELPDQFHDIALGLQQFSPEERRKACLELLHASKLA